MLYAGLTRVLNLMYDEGAQEFALSAARVYDLAGHGVATRYPDAQVQRLATDLTRYLAAVRVKPRYVEKEGRCQAWLSRRFGVGRTAPGEWATVDRESVIGFPNTPTKNGFWAPILDNARRTLAVLSMDQASFGSALTARRLGGELDLLLWDPEAREFLVTEVKDGRSARGVYLSPLQVGCYLAAWRAFAAADPQGALSGLRDLLAQRQRLGLVRLACRLPETEGDLKFRPVIVVQSPNKSSSCWTTFEIVRRTANDTWRGGEARSNTQDFLAGLSVLGFTDGTLEDITQRYPQWVIPSDQAATTPTAPSGGTCRRCTNGTAGTRPGRPRRWGSA